MEYAVETLSLTKIFSDWWGRRKVYAVDELNLQIQHNEVFGLLGPNGSGKTTTLRLLLGLLHPTKGRAMLLGGDGADPKINSRIGFLPEESYLYKYLSARETLDFYGRLFGLPAKIRRMRTEALLDMVGLKAVANRAVGTYSKGMARRIGLAQALINDPDLLILDEPTSGLDPIGTRQIKDLILKLAERGKTIMLCSHLLGDVEDVCDRIAILYGGKIQSQGRVAELLQKSDKRQIITDKISDSTIEKIKHLIQQENADCEVTSPMDKLETFFIKIVETAQQQSKRTSGAISTTKIGGFLTEEAPIENILDKLVSAPVTVQNQIVSAERAVAGQKKPADETASVDKINADAADGKLLSNLTGSVQASAKKTPVRDEQTRLPDGQVSTQPVKPHQDSGQDGKIQKDILDRLAGRLGSQGSDEKQTDKSKAENPGNK